MQLIFLCNHLLLFFGRGVYQSMVGAKVNLIFVSSVLVIDLEICMQMI